MERARLYGLVVTAAAAFALAAFVGAILSTIYGFGPWFDEFFTTYVARPVIPWREALVDHWLTDNHPPLYYALARTFWWIGDTIEHRRLVNLVPFVAALGGGLVLARPRAELHRLAALLAISLAAQGVVVRIAADYRSYFLSVSAIALLVFALAAFHADAARWRRRDSAVLWCVAIVALNTHITTTIVASAIQIPFLLRYLVRRDLARFWRLALPSLVAGLLFVAVSAVQAQHWLANTTAFWLPAGWNVARWTLELLVVEVAQANPVLLVAALGGFAAAAVGLMRRRTADAQLETAIFLGIGWMLAIGIILAIHAWRPFIYERYLVGLVPVMAMILALGSEQALRRIGLQPALAVLVLAALVSAASAWHAASTKRQNSDWGPSAALVGQLVAACPASLVHTDPLWNREVLDLAPDDNRAVVPFAYRMMAARYHFALEDDASRRLAKGCPTLFWAEWTRPQEWSAPEILARIRQRGFPVSRIRVTRFQRSFVAVADPQ
ncbi:hypothetical protein [Novosphingobium olei]|uniref:Glycosyltransferase RgtA/B/C/D-like domain-containing protein n=1 Tax=Novosphingobium olei TaxID=2728851 RepID=A0A7Y0BSV9_9SPHN|nr:hypothetical protein [Novosphingobium olei]NML95853.1 hypothetical protein [Novosphingobium olei]